VVGTGTGPAGGDSSPAGGDEGGPSGSPRGDSGDAVARLVARHIIDVPGFPKDGVVFKDLSPLFADGMALRAVTDAIVAQYAPDGFDVVAGIEARGFLVAAAVGYATGAGVVPVRKAGKLPRQVLSASYELEYGEATLEVHADAFLAGQRVLIVDDVLATGGTAAACGQLVRQAGGGVVGISVLIELGFLAGRARLTGYGVHALLTV
jgi:adenine phosphoribosyltransferase